MVGTETEKKSSAVQKSDCGKSVINRDISEIIHYTNLTLSLIRAIQNSVSNKKFLPLKASFTLPKVHKVSKFEHVRLSEAGGVPSKGA